MSFPIRETVRSSLRLSTEMSQLVRWFLLPVLVAAPMAFQPWENPARADLGKSESVQLALDEMGSRASRIVDVAKNAGDFISWRTAQQASALIDAWKRTNSARLPTFFGEADPSTQNLFREMSDVLDRIYSGGQLNVAEARRFTAEWSEAIKLMPEDSKKAEVLDYQPRIFLSGAEGSRTLDITGRHLENVDTMLLANNDQKISFKLLSEKEIIANVSDTAFQFEDSTPLITTIRLMIRDKNSQTLEERDLPIWLLPKRVARLTVKQILKEVNVENTTFSAVVHSFGKDTIVDDAVHLPQELVAQDWRVDTEKISSSPNRWLTDIEGDHGRCLGLRSDSSNDQAVVAEIELGHSTKLWGEKRDAHQGCKVTIPIKRVTEREMEGPVVQRDIGWSYTEKIKLPENTVSFEAQLKLFNGRSYVIAGNSQLSLDLISVYNANNILQIESHEPVSF
jgi:hypothetical protein